MSFRTRTIGIAAAIGIAASLAPSAAFALYVPWYFGTVPGSNGTMTCMSGPGVNGCYDSGGGYWYTPSQVNWLMDAQDWFRGIVFW